MTTESLTNAPRSPATAADLTDLKRHVAAAVETARETILAVSHAIHADPEPAFEEHHAAALVAATLARLRLRREPPGGPARDRGPGDAGGRARR